MLRDKLNWTLLDAIDDGGDKVTLRKGNLYYPTVVFDIYRGSATAIAGSWLSLSLFIWPEDGTTSLFEGNGPFRAYLFFFFLHRLRIHTYNTFPPVLISILFLQGGPKILCRLSTFRLYEFIFSRLSINTSDSQMIAVWLTLQCGVKRISALPSVFMTEFRVY